MATEDIIDVDAESVASAGTNRNSVIDLLSSSDEENNDDGEAGGVTVSSILREHYPEMMASQSQEHQTQNGCDLHERTHKGKNESIHQASDINASNHASEFDFDDEIESFDHQELRSLEFLRNHCWACHLWIEGFESNQNNDEICYNALHLHPVLGVPVCVVCAETIEAVERKQLPERIVSNKKEGQTTNRSLNKGMEDEREDNSTACNACGKFEEYEGEHVRCDVCPRTICPNCFEQARYSVGGSDDKVLHSSRKRPRPRTVQKCFCCSCLEKEGVDEDSDENGSKNHSQKPNVNDQLYHDLPPFLEKLRSQTQRLFSSSNRTTTKQSLNDLIDELNTLEKEKRKCESNLDDPRYLLEEIGKEVSEDLDREKHEGEDPIFDIRVEHLYRERYDEWTNHHTRLMDRITILGDRFKAEHGIEAADVLRYIEASNNADAHGEYLNSDNRYEEAEPLYKVAADYEISKREKDERLRRRKEEKRLAEKRSDDPKYLLEITEDAEDLGSSDEVDTLSGGDVSNNGKADAYDNGWRNAPFRARKQDIEAALRAEDTRRIEEGKMTLICCSKNRDIEEINKWDSGLKSSAMIVKKKSKKRKRVSTRTVSMPTGKSPSTANAASTLRAGQKHDREKIRNGNHNSAAFGEPFDDSNINTIVAKPKALQRSAFVLSTNPFICIAEEFDGHLKEHQKEGIRFMYKSTFADLGGEKDANIGGCILAHSMGLGKSLSCVSLLYAVMMQPSLYDSVIGRGKIHKALLVVPTNTMANWENEFDKWTKGINKRNKLSIFNVSKAEKYGRCNLVKHWSSVGGILLTSIGLFRTMAGREDTGKLLSATDVVVLDESHTMLKNKGSKTYKAFIKIKTSRRICLTGTPFQNNLLEYHRMLSFIRPNILGNSEKKFQKEFIDPIQSAMASNATDNQKKLADDCLTRFVKTVGPFIHRRDASLLRKDLPSLQQVCLHVPPTKIQRAFYGAFRKHQERTNEKNFLKHYSSLRTVHNHPGTLLFRNDNPRDFENKKQNSIVNSPAEETTPELPTMKKEPTEPTDNELFRKFQDNDYIIEILSSDDEEDGTDENYETNDKWWEKAAKKIGTEKMKHIESGNKCIVLLHILTHVAMLGEKTVVFSQSLKTLDFLSEVLASEDWQTLCPSLKDSFPGQSMGGWIQGKDFLRIDGRTSGIERGELLKDFSQDSSLKLFLISSVAGGIGINLVSASRVILFDSHFNPTIDLQAVFRCYRYGQPRDVFSYRLLTQGTMEEKVYSRAMNKTSLGNRVIDGKKLHRCFEQDEIDSLTKVDDWVECTRCRKWRMFPPDHKEDLANIPDDWHCKLMNKCDARMDWTCSFEEKDSVWYHPHFKKPNQMITADTCLGTIDTESINKLSTVESEKLVEKDEVLKRILAIKSSTDKSASIVSKHYFHGTLHTDIEATNSNENVRND